MASIVSYHTGYIESKHILDTETKNIYGNVSLTGTATEIKQFVLDREAETVIYALLNQDWMPCGNSGSACFLCQRTFINQVCNHDVTRNQYMHGCCFYHGGSNNCELQLLERRWSCCYKQHITPKCTWMDIFKVPGCKALPKDHVVKGYGFELRNMNDIEELLKARFYYYSLNNPTLPTLPKH